MNNITLIIRMVIIIITQKMCVLKQHTTKLIKLYKNTYITINYKGDKNNTHTK